MMKSDLNWLYAKHTYTQHFYINTSWYIVHLPSTITFFLLNKIDETLLRFVNCKLIICHPLCLHPHVRTKKNCYNKQQSTLIIKIEKNNMENTNIKGAALLNIFLTNHWYIFGINQQSSSYNESSLTLLIAFVCAQLYI